MSDATPGQAARATFESLTGGRLNTGQRWDRAAQAAIDAFLAGDSVSAESIREALAAQDARPAPELVPALPATEGVYLYHWRFDRGEEFGLYWRKADADAMAARRAGDEGFAEVLGMAILGERGEPQPAPEPAAAMRETAADNIRLREGLDNIFAVLDRQTLTYAERISRARTLIRTARDGKS